jgi:hypothetical protein
MMGAAPHFKAGGSRWALVTLLVLHDVLELESPVQIGNDENNSCNGENYAELCTAAQTIPPRAGMCQYSVIAEDRWQLHIPAIVLPAVDALLVVLDELNQRRHLGEVVVEIPCHTLGEEEGKTGWTWVEEKKTVTSLRPWRSRCVKQGISGRVRR